MLKRITIVLFLIYILSINVYAIDNDILSEQIDSIGIENAGLDYIVDQDVFDGLTIGSLSEEIMSGGWSWNPIDILNRSFAFYLKEVYANIKIILIIVIMAIVSSVLTNMQGSFNRDGINEMGFFICFCIIVGIAVRGFGFIVEGTLGLVENLSVFIQAIVPMAMAITVAGGSASGATVFQPVIIGSTQAMTLVIKDFLLPLLMISVAVSIANNFTGQFELSKIVELMRKIIKWTLGIMLTFFVSVMTIYGMVSPVLDGAVIKSAKFAVGNFIPVVGGMLSESVNVVAGYSLILKNAFGAAGMIMTLIICFVPLVKIIATISVFHLGAAVIQPICDKRLSNVLTDIASSMTLIFIMVLVLEMVFLINFAIAIMAGNSAALLGR